MACLPIARLLGFAFLLCLFASPVRAQQRRILVFGTIGGAGLGHADSEQGSAPIVGGGVGLHLSPRLVVEADVHTARVDHVFGRANHDFTQTTLTASLLFRSNPNGRAHFMSGGGVALQRAHIDIDDPPFRIDRIETSRFLHGRGGVGFDISNRLAIRSEGVLWFGDGLDWIVGARAGFQYRF